MTIIADETRKARKAHLCIWCGQQIKAGEAYRRQRLVFQGDIQSNSWHPECFDSVDWQEYEDGFSPYEGERPSLSGGNTR